MPEAPSRAPRPPVTVLGAMLVFIARVHAQEVSDDQLSAVPQTIEAEHEQQTDDIIRDRLDRIFAQIDGLGAVQVDVSEGVVTLSGAVADQAEVQRAEDISLRIRGVVAVQNNTGASVDVGETGPKHRPAASSQATSVAPDDHLDDTIAAERSSSTEDDLLNPRRPIE